MASSIGADLAMDFLTTTHLPVEHVFFDGGQFAQIGKGTRRIMVPFLYLAIKSLYWSKGGTLKKIMWCDDDAIKPYFIAAGKALTYGSMRRQMADSLEDKPFPALPEDLQCRCWFEFGSAEDHLKYRAGNAGYSDVRSQEVFRAVSEPVPGRAETGLDFHNQILILDMIKRLAREEGISAIINTRYPTHAMSVADEARLLIF